MAPPLLIAHPQNATIEELKQVFRLGSNETATRCSAIQMLLAGAHRELVCNALLVTHRGLRNLIMDNASWHKRKTTNWHNWQANCESAAASGA